MDVLNNTILSCDIGIRWQVPTNYLQGRLFNNIVANPGTYYLYLAGTVSNFTLGYNLYYPTLNTTNAAQFCCIGDDKGPSNVLANPLLTVSTPTTYVEATPLAGSPVISAGTNIGLPYAGAAPDIGAIEFTDGSSRYRARRRLLQ